MFKGEQVISISIAGYEVDQSSDDRLQVWHLKIVELITMCSSLILYQMRNKKIRLEPYQALATYLKKLENREENVLSTSDRGTNEV